MLKKNGYITVLGLLIVLVIGMMIYFLDMKAIFGPGLQHISRPAMPEDKPWNLEDLLIPQGQSVEVPKKGQPELLEPVHVSASAARNNFPRGLVKLDFGKDCRILAEWSAQYDHEKKSYRLQTRMTGNTVSSRLYSDPNGNEDKTRLFFIGKGPYTQITEGIDVPTQTEQGTAYILGWLKPDHSVSGTITITTDQTWSAVYDFHTVSKAAVK